MFICVAVKGNVLYFLNKDKKVVAEFDDSCIFNEFYGINSYCRIVPDFHFQTIDGIEIIKLLLFKDRSLVIQTITEVVKGSK